MAKTNSLDIEVKRLINERNVCFANSTLQVIISIPEIIDLYTKNGSTEFPLYQCLQGYCNTAVNGYFNPRKYYSSMLGPNRLFDGSQQDAHEFLIKLIEKLYLDIGGTNQTFTAPENLIAMKKMNTIANVFYGMLKSRYECRSCRQVSITHVETNNLSLRPTTNIIDSISEYFHEEIITKKCENCHSNISTVNTTLINHPTILILHLNRFNMDKSKNVLSVKVEKRLVIHKARYELLAIIMHSGSVASGHYTSYAKRKGDWHLFDDDVVQKLEGDPDLSSSKPYILFYKLYDEYW